MSIVTRLFPFPGKDSELSESNARIPKPTHPLRFHVSKRFQLNLCRSLHHRALAGKPSRLRADEIGEFLDFRIVKRRNTLALVYGVELGKNHLARQSAGSHCARDTQHGLMALSLGDFISCRGLRDLNASHFKQIDRCRRPRNISHDAIGLSGFVVNRSRSQKRQRSGNQWGIAHLRDGKTIGREIGREWVNAGEGNKRSGAAI
jgi:hypothetical protein